MDKKIEWDGKGMPPVGAVVEYVGIDSTVHYGSQVEIVAHFKGGMGDMLAAYVFRADGYTRIAQAVGWAFAPVGSTRKSVSQEINGELLDTLEELVELAEGAMREANRDGACYNVKEELEQARAAIAKAKGGAA